MTLVEELKKLCESEELQANADRLDGDWETTFDDGCAAASERIVKEIRALIAKYEP